MSSNPFAAYLETQVLSASPVKLIYLAYEGAIGAVTEARNHIKEKRIRERSEAITKVQMIITELQSSLDYQKGGDISVQLGQLYDYIQRRLNEANFKQIEEPLAEVQGLLETLASAWREIAANDNSLAASASSSIASSASWIAPVVDTPVTPAAESFVYTPAGQSVYSPVETPAYSWAGSSGYGRTESAYTRADYTL